MLLTLYRQALARRPLLTQMLSAGVIGCSGDAISQFYMEGVHPAGFDYARSMRFFLLPTLYIAPILSKWFRLLERVVGNSGKTAPLKKVLVDQTCFAPFFSASILLNLRLLEGFSPREAWIRLKQDFWPIYSRSIQFWPVIQLLNFYFVPLNFRVVFVQLAALLWNIFLSHQTQTRSKLPIPPLE